MTIIYGSPEADKQKERDRILNNRDQVQVLVGEAILLDTKLEGDTATDAGKFLAQCVIEELDGEEWLMIQGFFTELFKWIDDYHDEMIPQKYMRPYVIMAEIKQHVLSDPNG